MFDWLVVGAGFAGSVLAERLASQRDIEAQVPRDAANDDASPVAEKIAADG